MGGAYPGMDQREVSYNKVSIDGGTVVGWYTLPRAKAAYRTPEGNDNTTLLTTDCAAAADRDVAFPLFVGINFIFNQYFSTTYSGYGTPATSLAIDGQTRTYRMTWIADDGWLTQTLLAHEMGHTWGLGRCTGLPRGSPVQPWSPRLWRR